MASRSLAHGRRDYRPPCVGSPEHNDSIFPLLATADAVVYVHASDSPLRIDDLHTVERIRDSVHGVLFFACTHFNWIKEEEQELVKAYLRSHLAPLTALGADGVLFVDAERALTGRDQQDAEQVASSGVPELESALLASLGARNRAWRSAQHTAGPHRHAGAAPLERGQASGPSIKSYAG